MNFGFQSESQSEQYDKYRLMGFEYSLTEPNGIIHMERKERGYDYVRTLEKIALLPDGTVDNT